MTEALAKIARLGASRAQALNAHSALQTPSRTKLRNRRSVLRIAVTTLQTPPRLSLISAL